MRVKIKLIEINLHDNRVDAFAESRKIISHTQNDIQMENFVFILGCTPTNYRQIIYDKSVTHNLVNFKCFSIVCEFIIVIILSRVCA